MSNPGQLNRRLVLEAPVEVDDGAGGVTRGYQAVTTLWASVTPVSAQDEFAAARLGVRVTHRIGLRAWSAITTRHRLRDGSTIYRIVSFRDRDGSGRFLDITAEQRID